MWMCGGVYLYEKRAAARGAGTHDSFLIWSFRFKKVGQNPKELQSIAIFNLLSWVWHNYRGEDTRKARHLSTALKIRM
jgi:hypothetical protein